MDVSAIVRDAVIARTERILYKQWDTERIIDIDQALRQAVAETTEAILDIIKKRI